jgi:transposase
MGVKEWLWTASIEGFCLFHAADTRGRVELETMLGTEFAGVLSSDDFSVYHGGNIAAQQKCLAHLRRHFQKALELPGNNNAAVAQIFLSLIDLDLRRHTICSVDTTTIAPRLTSESDRRLLSDRL